MAQILDELTTDFSGGMDDSSAPTAIARNAASLIQNGRIDPDGTIRRRSGSRRKHAAALAAGVGYGAIWFTPPGLNEQIIAFVGTSAFMSNDIGNSTWTEIATGLRADYYDFATMRVGGTLYLFAANGDTTIKRWNGTTWDTLPNAPAGVKYIETFNERVWVTGHNGPIVQASKIRDPATWASPDGILVQITTHGGEGVPTGLFQLGAQMLVFEEHATSYIDGFGEQTLIVASGGTGFSRSVGCSAFRSIVAVGDSGVCWLSERGVEFYETGRGIQLLTRNIQGFMDSIGRAAIRDTPGEPTATYDPIRQNYSLALSTNGIRNDRTLVLNMFHRGAASIDTQADVAVDVLLAGDDDGYLTADEGGFEVVGDFDGYLTLSSGGAGEPMTEDADGYLVTATNDALPATLFMGPCRDGSVVMHSLGYDGFVRKHYEYSLDDEEYGGTGGANVVMTIVSRPFLMRQPRHRKRVRAVRVSAIAESAATISVAVRAAGTISNSRNITVSGTLFNQSRRAEAKMHAIGDTPQIQVQSTDQVKVSLIGLSAELLREAI